MMVSTSAARLETTVPSPSFPSSLCLFQVLPPSPFFFLFSCFILCFVIGVCLCSTQSFFKLFPWWVQSTGPAFRMIHLKITHQKWLFPLKETVHWSPNFPVLTPNTVQKNRLSLHSSSEVLFLPIFTLNSVVTTGTMLARDEQWDALLGCTSYTQSIILSFS